MFGSRLFPGGVHPHEGVSGKRVNGGNAIKELPAPPRLVIPLQQHIGAPAKAVVKKGNEVLYNIEGHWDTGYTIINEKTKV